MCVLFHNVIISTKRSWGVGPVSNLRHLLVMGFQIHGDCTDICFKGVLGFWDSQANGLQRVFVSIGKLCQLLDSESSEVMSVIWDEIAKTGSNITMKIS